MKCTTSCASEASKASSANGNCSAEACWTSTPGWRSRAAATKDSEGSTAETADGLDRLTSSAMKAPWTAADVQDSPRGAHLREVAELRRERDRVPAHERVVRLSRNIEHRDNLRAGPRCRRSAICWRGFDQETLPHAGAVTAPLRCAGGGCHGRRPGTPEGLTGRRPRSCLCGGRGRGERGVGHEGSSVTRSATCTLLSFIGTSQEATRNPHG